MEDTVALGSHFEIVRGLQHQDFEKMEDITTPAEVKKLLLKPSAIKNDMLYKDLKPNNFIDITNKAVLSDQRFVYREIQPDDIILSVRGRRLYMALVPKDIDLWNAHYFLGFHLVRISAISSIPTGYLYAVLLGMRDCESVINHRSSYDGALNISTLSLRDLQIPVRPQEEMQAISNKVWELEREKRQNASRISEINEELSSIFKESDIDI